MAVRCKYKQYKPELLPLLELFLLATTIFPIFIFYFKTGMHFVNFEELQKVKTHYNNTEIENITTTYFAYLNNNKSTEANNYLIKETIRLNNTSLNVSNTTIQTISNEDYLRYILTLQFNENRINEFRIAGNTLLLCWVATLFVLVLLRLCVSRHNNNKNKKRLKDFMVAATFAQFSMIFIIIFLLALNALNLFVDLGYNKSFLDELFLPTSTLYSDPKNISIFVSYVILGLSSLLLFPKFKSRNCALLLGLITLLLIPILWYLTEVGVSIVSTLVLILLLWLIGLLWLLGADVIRLLLTIKQAVEGIKLYFLNQ